MARSREEAIAILIKKALLKTKNYKVKALVGIKDVWKMLTAVLDTGTDRNRLEKNFLSGAWV